MASGAGVGYPDWQRYSNWVGPALFTLSAASIGTVATTEGPFSVPQWQSVMVVVSTGLNSIRIAVESAPSDVVGPVSVPRVFDITPSTVATFIFQNNTDRVVFNISTNSGTSTCTISAHPCNLSEGVFETTNLSGIIATGVTTVAAGGTSTIVLPFFFGHARINVGYSKAGFQTSLRLINIAGTIVATMFLEESSGLVTNTDIIFPSMITNLIFFNPDAASQTANWVIVGPTP